MIDNNDKTQSGTKPIKKETSENSTDKAQIKRQKKAKKIVDEILKKRESMQNTTSEGKRSTESAKTPNNNDTTTTQTSNKNAVEDVELIKKMQALELKNSMLLEKLAELDNIVKRKDKEIAKAAFAGSKQFATSMSEVSENIRRALESIPKQDLSSLDTEKFVKNMEDGLNLTIQSIDTIFQKHELLRIFPKKGDEFDPLMHQAVQAVPAPDMKDNLILETFQAGYHFKGTLLKPAMVITVKNG